jgi:plastocyanin
MKSLLVLVSTLATTFAFAAVVEFHIPAGTNNGPWNTSLNPIVANVGDTIRFYNDDSVKHTLHTYGAPCGHGNLMAPGGSWDCFAEAPFNSEVDGPLYDHHYGEEAEVWFNVRELK